MKYSIRWLFLVGALLQGCAGVRPSFDMTGVDKQLTPEQVLANPSVTRGHKVLWGGVILSIKNLKDVTQIEVMSYALDESSSRPETTGTPRRRFLANFPGYLETSDYSPGRQLTVIGTVDGIKTGKIGDASYDYPLLQASQRHLWPKVTPSTEPRFHFGVGIGITR
jgi:outer membrane lipoprotein